MNHDKIEKQISKKGMFSFDYTKSIDRANKFKFDKYLMNKMQQEDKLKVDKIDSDDTETDKEQVNHRPQLNKSSSSDYQASNSSFDQSSTYSNRDLFENARVASTSFKKFDTMKRKAARKLTAD